MSVETNRIGSFYDVGQQKAIASIPNVGIDESEMSATAIITTPAWDRQNDSLNPLGGDFTNYQKNPVVYFDHGLVVPEPIATSGDKDGKLWLFPNETGIVAKSFFSNRNKQSEQFFFLVADRILRGTSVRFTPLERPVKKSQGNRFEKWTLEEWCWTGLGVNPEAVAEVIAKGRINGSNIDGAIMKSLSPYTPKPAPHGIKKSGTKTIATGSMSPNLERIMTVKLLGQQVMESAHGQLAEFDTKLKSTLKFVENPKVKEVMQSVEKGIGDLLVMLEGGYSESYAKSLKSCSCSKEKMLGDSEFMKKFSEEDRKKLDEDEEFLKSKIAEYEEECEEDDEAKMKSFVASSPGERFKVSGLATRLDDLAADEGTPIHVRSQLKSVVSSLASIIKSALVEPEKGDSELEAKKKSMQADIEQLKKKLEAAMPHSR